MSIYASFSLSSDKLMTLSNTTTLSNDTYQNSRRHQCFNINSMLNASNTNQTQTNSARAKIIQMIVQYNPQLHNRAILLLLLLIRPTKTFTLHLHFTSTTLELLKTFLSFGEFVCCKTSLAIYSSPQSKTFKTYLQPDHTTVSPHPNCEGSLYPLQ